jgi:glucokinase
MAGKKFKKIVFSADIGGTNVNLSIVGFMEKRPEILLKTSQSTSSVNKLSDSVNKFLDYAKQRGYEPREGCLAVAGPVEGGNGDQRVKMTNTELEIDSSEIERKTPLKNVLIINDYGAISFGINVIGKRNLVTLNPGKPVKRGVRAVVGAGTGLGKNILYFHKDANSYVPLPSEGGHSDLPLLGGEEFELAEFIKKKKGVKNQVRYEDVLSGGGLEIIYQFLNETRFPNSPRDLTDIEITETRNNNECSKETLDMFIRFYARCCRNFALDTLARGGLYIAGGIAAKNTESFSNFFKEFIKNEQFSDILKDIPVHIITNYDISLIGAAYALTLQKYL